MELTNRGQEAYYPESKLNSTAAPRAGPSSLSLLTLCTPAALTMVLHLAIRNGSVLRHHPRFPNGALGSDDHT